MDTAHFLQYIVSGTAITLGVTLIALPLGLTMGVLLALFYVYGGKLGARLMQVYSIVLRGIPPIVLLFILYFVVSGAINLGPFLAGALALGIVSSAYQMEIVRGAILSVDAGQMMAARAVGLSRPEAIRNVVLPQALRHAIAPWSNEAAIVIKDSSLVYALGVPEVLRRAQLIGTSSQNYLLAYGAAAAIYFLMVWVADRGLISLEKKLRIPGSH